MFNNTRLIAAVFFLGLAHTALATEQQPPPNPPAVPAPRPFKCHRSTDQGTFSGFQLTEENDSVIKLGGDERYTQGLRLTFNFHKDAVPCAFQNAGHWLQSRVWPHSKAFTTDMSLLFGHSLYTPRIITSRTLDAQDRGFADFTYLGAQLSLTSSDVAARHIFEAVAGALGSEGLAKGTQGGLHALKMHRIPKGWYSTEPKTVGANLRYRYERRTFCDNLKPNCFFDATSGWAAEAGNVRSSFGFHTTARLGYGITGFPAAVIPTAAARTMRRRWEVAAIVGVEGRAIANTAFVQATPGSVGFEKEPLVGDARWGFYVRYQSLRATYQHLYRSAEFRIANVPKRDQEFASIAVSYEPETVLATPTKKRAWPLRDWELELGMGPNFFGPKLDTGNERGVTAQVVARKGLAKGFNLGLVELSSATVEGAPTPGEPGNRSDIFLRQRAVTLGWGHEGKAGKIAIRAGSALWGGNARVETIFHQGGNGLEQRCPGRTGEYVCDVDFRAPRGGWLVGGQYFPPLEPHLSLGIDVSYHSVKLAGTVPGVVEPRYLQVLLTAQIRP